MNAMCTFFVFYLIYIVVSAPPNYNYILGTQSIGASYHFFSNMSVLQETAYQILWMGSNTIKLSQVDDPDFKVIDMPFYYTFLWWRSQDDTWFNGLNNKDKAEEYTATYNFAVQLLTRYNNSGRNFYLGHWEGDWYLLHGYNTNVTVSDTTINGMIDWLNTRQQAVDDAKKNTPHTNVNVYHYTEANRVLDAMAGLPRVANRVLPNTNVDYVSYSSYDVELSPQETVNQALSFLQSHLRSKPNIPGKRLFVGEFAWPQSNTQGNATEHEIVNRGIILKYLNWGVDFILYWEMYNNEVDSNGNQVGFWLINNLHQKLPLYYTFQQLYTKGAEYIDQFNNSNHRYPTQEEYTRWAISNLSSLDDNPLL